MSRNHFAGAALALTFLLCSGCASLPGPKYPPPAPPLVDEPAKTIDIDCSAVEAGARFVEDGRQ